MIAFPDIDPVAVRIGPIALRWYGIAYVIGIVGAWWLATIRAKRDTAVWSGDQIGDLMFYAALGIVLGGRFGYALFYHLPVYLHDPLGILRVWEGGMSFHGGLLGVILAMWLFARKTKRPFFQISDFVAPLVPLGLFTGRLANFINGELWGAPTDLPWAVVFPDPRAGGIPRHPTQLYEAFLEGLVLFTILWLYSRKPRPTRAVSGLFLICYGCFRFAVELVREPDPQLGYLAFGWLTMGQILSAPMIMFGGWLIVTAYRAGHPWRQAASRAR